MNMKKITKFVAEDGAEFDTAQECQNYEYTNLFKKVKGLTLYTKDRKVVEMGADMVFDDVEYVKVMNIEAVKVLHSFCETNQYISPFERVAKKNLNEATLGLYFWDKNLEMSGEINCWTCVNDRLKEIEKEAKFLKGLNHEFGTEEPTVHSGL
jgi:hypothetical protein